MRITLDITPGQVHNLPLPLREEVMQAAGRQLKKEEGRLRNEIAIIHEREAYVNQQLRQLSEWEELLG